ncbi:response regulator [Lysobacter sp. GX 14042]|uniref:response regulator n=1 Tax=Lysobacter sp. GX 14042 TaxID=2907155 RepID=UPI001F3493C3|nr:response regulator [Lysobacter sp. GX 14042]MCE7032430.1 response regulator [Lysobacter sp. GX 14042]
MNPDAELPRLLLVEDDPTSRAYLAAALQALPARVELAAGMEEALTLAGRGRHRAWLLDANLPDGSGARLLRRLRELDRDTPALCHTADPDPATLAALRDQGFDQIIGKPIEPGALREAVRRHLPAAVPLRVAEQPLRWDDAAATRALNGERAHVDTLRGLFLAELPQARARIHQALADGRHDQAHAELHKLRASCGFVGAGQLAARVRALAQDPGSTAALTAFDAAVEDLLEP